MARTIGVIIGLVLGSVIGWSLARAVYDGNRHDFGDVIALLESGDLKAGDPLDRALDIAKPVGMAKHVEVSGKEGETPTTFWTIQFSHRGRFLTLYQANDALFAAQYVHGTHDQWFFFDATLFNRYVAAASSSAAPTGER